MRKSDVDHAVMMLAVRKFERAVFVLARFGAHNTSELKREDYSAVIELATQELAKFDSQP
jgi:hypothetical protein